MSRLGCAALLLMSIAAPAVAEPTGYLSKVPPGTWIGDGRLKMVATPPEQFNSSPPFEVSNVLYLNRCTGGCMVTGGTMSMAMTMMLPTDSKAARATIQFPAAAAVMVVVEAQRQ